MDKLIVANCSGFFGDRISAAREMVEGGPIDVLTGDYLAELTMAILMRKKFKDPKAGYVPTFLAQMEEVMGACLDKGIKVVSNAGGLNPAGLAEALENVAGRLGLNPKIAYIDGDDLMPRLEELQALGEKLTHLDKGLALSEAAGSPISANAYLGCWGVAEALSRGADIVVGGRLADAAVVMGPAAWRFGWKRDDWDQLAGAAAAGHVIECSGQATGGNYSFIDEVPSYKNVGFPMAEVHADGSAVITKHPGTGGLVSVGTITAQLLYEIRQPHYLTPDVVACFDTLELEQEGPDRVRLSRIKGLPPTETTKVCLNLLSGYRNSMTLVLTGLDIEEKARIFEETLFDSLGGRDTFAQVDVQLTRPDRPDPQSNDEAWAYMKISVMDPDKNKVGRLFSSKFVELALANIPGFTATSPPGGGDPAIVHWPALVSNRLIEQTVTLNGERFTVGPPESRASAALDPPDKASPAAPSGPTVKAPLGRAFAARSGDKGGNANMGVWHKTPEGYAFLRDFLTVDRLKTLLADLAPYEIERYELPNLKAVNFYIKGLLGEGVAASTRNDPQAKTLGEYLRARIVDMPQSIVVKH
ncbi:MAG: DUF1446 domain-containing protein [Proteobacteria bacterium]|nr:DUF1446 domain-containing protein [Pseudomonadota bacterium]